MEGGAPLPEFRDRGRSEILDWRVNRLARIEGAGEAIATAPIDIDALRKVRKRWAFGHMSSQAFVAVYQKETWPLNRLPKSERDGNQIRDEVLRKLVEKGRLTE